MLWSLLFISLIAICNTDKLILGGKTSQTSHYTDNNGVSYTSERAIDGNLDKCAHTDQHNNSWWNIDLLSVYNISNITIYEIEQYNIDLIGAQIRIGNSSETDGTANSMCTTITAFNKGQNSTFKCDNGSMLGRYVTVYSKTQGLLILCEVWIYGTIKVSPFKLINENKTWEDALDTCRAQNMDLASTPDKDTHVWAELEAMKANSPFVWLGLHYTCTLEFWFWVNDHPLRYRRWAPGQETGECDKSVAMETTGDHHWFRKSDNEMFNFICAP